MENKMFCFQCQETAQCTGCTRVGVCGKSATTEGGHGVIDRLEQGHATHPVGQEAEHGEHQIDHDDVVGDRLGTRGAFV